MLCIFSTLFRVLKFLHEGNIVTVDQLSFFTSSSENNVLYVDKILTPYESIGSGLFKDPALMGIFPLPPHNTIQINMISWYDNPWINPSPEQVDSFGDSMPLSLIEIDYFELLVALNPPLSDHAPLSMSLDAYSQSPWLGDSDSSDPLQEIFPSNEAIVETMSLKDLLWDDGHHPSSFMPSLGAMSTCLERFSSQVPYPPLKIPILTHEVFTEGNLNKITQTMPIEISVKPGIVENIHLGVTYSSDEF